MNQRKNSTILFPAVLFCMFAFCSFLVLIYGVHAYQSIQDRADTNYQQSVPLTYLTNKVRSGDEQGMVSIDTIDGVSCLVLTSTGDETYRNYVYVKDGELYDLLIPASRVVKLDEGLPVMKVASLQMEQKDSTITFTLDAQGKSIKQKIALRSY